MKTIQVTLDDHVHRRAKSHASNLGITLGEVVRQAVAAFLEEPKRPQPSARGMKGVVR